MTTNNEKALDAVLDHIRELYRNGGIKVFSSEKTFVEWYYKDDQSIAVQDMINAILKNDGLSIEDLGGRRLDKGQIAYIH